MANFADVFYESLGKRAETYKTGKWLDSSGKHNIMPEVCKNHLNADDNVAVLAIRYSAQDIYDIRKTTNGKIYLIDMGPEYPYELIKNALMKGTETETRQELTKFLPQPEEHYFTEEGLKDINQLFSEINVECMVQQFPPLPEKIPDSSLDAVFIMSLFATPDKGRDGDLFYTNLIESIEKKLKPKGKIIAEESFGSDLIYAFKIFMRNEFKHFENKYRNMEQHSCWMVFERNPQ